uniref:Protein LEG1 homolog n=2 Tax=Sparus aurata TaxID=8175 RepID=A0A671YGJ5_SPAAU
MAKGERVYLCVCSCGSEHVNVGREYISLVSVQRLSVLLTLTLSAVMLHPTVLGLLLACAVSLSSSAVVLENGMPILWAHTAGQVTDMPIQEGILTPDPWNYLQRMSLLRLTISATDPFLGCMGGNATDSPLWGLALQLGWMLTSGRLADPTGTTTCGLQTGDTMCISPQSWWGCVNYFTSVLPFLSAAQQGFMGPGVQVQMMVPEGVTDYCTTYTDCAAKYADPMTKWDAFFQGLSAETDPSVSDNEKKDNLLGLYWDAQTSSTHATAACNDRKVSYSSTEKNFMRSWLNSAEYVSASRFQSSLEKSKVFLEPLPSRILQEADVAPNIADLSLEENSTLSTFSWLDRINTLLGGSLVTMWKRAMCTFETREKGRVMMEQLMTNPTEAMTNFISVVTQITRSC